MACYGSSCIRLAIIASFSIKKAAKAAGLLQKADIYVRIGTGVILILIGVYLCLKHIFGILP